MFLRLNSPGLRLRRVAVGLVAVLALALVACGGGSTTDDGDGAAGTRIEVEGGAYFDITPRVLQSWLGDKDFLLVNVHVPYGGEIESTDELIPLDEIEGRLDAFPQRDGKIVVYCRSGSMSATAARTLVRLGYSNVWNLDGGMVAWQEAGYPLAPAQGP